MASLAFPSTSVLPDPSHRISTGSNSSQGSSGFESMKVGCQWAICILGFVDLRSVVHIDIGVEFEDEVFVFQRFR